MIQNSTPANKWAKKWYISGSCMTLYSDFIGWNGSVMENARQLQFTINKIIIIQYINQNHCSLAVILPRKELIKILSILHNLSLASRPTNNHIHKHHLKLTIHSWASFPLGEEKAGQDYWQGMWLRHSVPLTSTVVNIAFNTINHVLVWPWD